MTLSAELAQKVRHLGIDVNEVIARVLTDPVKKSPPPEVVEIRQTVDRLSWASGFAIAASLALAAFMFGEAKEAREELDRITASNYLVPKRLDVLGEVNELSDPHYCDNSGRNMISRFSADGDLAAVIYWEERGSDLNLPRFVGRFKKFKDANGNDKTTFIKSTEHTERTHRSPMQVAAVSGNWHIIKYYLHEDRRHKIHWDYKNHLGQTVLTICLRKANELGEQAPPVLSEIIETLTAL